MDYFKYLPTEITLDILSRLPTETVLECKLVSTNWRNQICHPSFGKMQLNHMNHPSTDADSGKLGFVVQIGHYSDDINYFEYNENHDESTTSPIQRITKINLGNLVRGSGIIGSCNGLICFAGGRGPFTLVCNPITREYVILPEIRDSNLPRYRYWNWTSGFGYLSLTDEYKIVKVYVAETNSVQVYIYTLGSGNGWRNLGKFYFESGSEWHEGIFVDGSLYWPDYTIKKIITFDLAEEKFCEHLSQPPFPAGTHWWEYDYHIGVLDGVLYFSGGLFGRGCFDVWLLKNKHEIKNQGEEHQSPLWSKAFRIDGSRLFCVTQSDKILTASYDYVNIYNPKTSTSKRLVKFKDRPLVVFPHKNTFVSLKQLEEEDTKTMESVVIGEPRSRDYTFDFEQI